MKIIELISQLSKYHPDTEVVMSSDSEGNSFSPLHEVATGLYVASSNWRGDVYGVHEKNLAGNNARNAVVLYPTK